MVVVNYIMWTVINNFIKVMPLKYQEARDEYVTTILGNRTSYRWKECIDRMQPVFGMPLGLLFVDVAFDEISKETVRRKGGEITLNAYVIFRIENTIYIFNRSKN